MRGHSYPALQSGSVLWRPATELARADVEAYPIFVEQPVLVAVEDHLSSAPDQGLLGFLVGRLCECLQTGIIYVHVHAAIRLPQTLSGDQSDAVVGQSWRAAQRLLQPTDGEIVGWYHSHPGGDLSLSPSDRSAHTRHFPQPWHVALVLSIGREETIGEFVRMPADLSANPPPPLPLPFYELLDPPGIRDGWKRARVSWSNHWSPDPAVWPATSSVVLEPRIDPPVPPVPKAPTRPRRAIVAPPVARPASAEPAQAELAEAKSRRAVAAPVGPHPLAPSPFGRGGTRPAPSEPAWDEVAEAKPRQRRRAPVLRVATLVAAGASLLAAGAFAGSRFVGQPRPASAAVMPSPSLPSSAPSNRVPEVPPPPALSPPASATAAVDADSLQRALEAYQLRATQFATGEVACEDLGRAMVEIDGQWIQYNLARTRAVSAGGVSDSARVDADQALALAVEQAEGDFERTGCPRP